MIRSKEQEMVLPVEVDELSARLNIPDLHLHYRPAQDDGDVVKQHQLALEEYFFFNDLSVSYDALVIEARFLHRIFPNIPVVNIVTLLREVGNENNRIRIVARKLCSINYNNGKLPNTNANNLEKPNGILEKSDNSVQENNDVRKRRQVKNNIACNLTDKKPRMEIAIMDINKLKNLDSKIHCVKVEDKENSNELHADFNHVQRQHVSLAKAVTENLKKSQNKADNRINSIPPLPNQTVTSSTPLKDLHLILHTLQDENKNIISKSKITLKKMASIAKQINVELLGNEVTTSKQGNAETIANEVTTSKQENAEIFTGEVTTSNQENLETVTNEATTSAWEYEHNLMYRPSTSKENKLFPFPIQTKQEEQTTAWENEQNVSYGPSTSKENKLFTFPVQVKLEEGTAEWENEQNNMYGPSTSKENKFIPFPVQVKEEGGITATSEWENKQKDMYSPSTSKENKFIPFPIQVKEEGATTEWENEQNNMYGPSTSKENKFIPFPVQVKEEEETTEWGNEQNNAYGPSTSTENNFFTFPGQIKQKEQTTAWGNEQNVMYGPSTSKENKWENKQNVIYGPSTSKKKFPVQIKHEEAVGNTETNLLNLNSEDLLNLRSDIIELSSGEDPNIDLTNENDEVFADTNEKEEQANPLVYRLMEIFPQASPEFLRSICKGKSNTPMVMDNLITEILSKDYPKRPIVQEESNEVDSKELFERLKELFPDADPTYLNLKAETLADKPDELTQFITESVEKHNYPTMKDYLRRQQLSSQQKQYTTNFSVEKFLEVIPDPVNYFNNPDRKSLIKNEADYHYVIKFLKNHFCRIPIRMITSQDIWEKSLIKVCSDLEVHFQMKTKRKAVPLPELLENIPLLQEIAYIKHKAEIETFLNERAIQDQYERRLAKESGLMQTCNCCYDEEVMPKHMATCNKGCVFCKECIRKSVEIAFGEGRLHFPCLAVCDSEFSLHTLQLVLDPKIFSKIALKKQLEEVKAAGIEDLECCPFCDFASIPAREDKLFRCLNPDCMKESCRLCKEPSHVPLRCDEVEKDEDIKARTYIENKMTEALIRICYKCGMKFIKADGCNKMTCSCGASMCYICNEPVTDYKHFNGQGGDRYDLCPLYSDTNKLHLQNVLKSAKQAKADLKKKDLKIDPTADIKKHYKRQSRHDSVDNIPPINLYVELNDVENQLQAEALVYLERLNHVEQEMIQHYHDHHRHRHHHHHRHGYNN